MEVPLAKPDITQREINAVVDVLKTPNLSLGPKLKEFEEKLKEFAGVKYAVAVNSGTSALHLIVKSLGIKDNDEVITTPFSFIASSNCILFERAKPVFVDIEDDTYNINPDLIEEKITEKTKAILAVDVFGHPADWDKLEKIAKKHDLFLIEDSAESLGSEYKGKRCGSFGDAGIFAFYPNKQITTGEGGVILTDNEKIYKLSRSMRNQGRGEDESWLEHVRLGYNFRISDINCALGLAQMGRIDEILNRRRIVYDMYKFYLKDIEEIILPEEHGNVKVSWFVFVIRLKDRFTRENRDNLIHFLKEKGIESKNYFSPIHLQKFYRELFGYKRGDFPVTEKISDRTLALPFFTSLTEEEINYVKDKLKEGITAISNS